MRVWRKHQRDNNEEARSCGLGRSFKDVSSFSEWKGKPLEDIAQNDSIISRYIKGRVADVVNIGCERKKSSVKYGFLIESWKEWSCHLLRCARLTVDL